MKLGKIVILTKLTTKTRFTFAWIRIKNVDHQVLGLFHFTIVMRPLIAVIYGMNICNTFY